METAMATHSSTLAWRIPWTEEPGGLLSVGSHRVGHDWSDFACMPALEREMATHSSMLAWGIPWTEEPGGLLSVGSHRVRYDWSDLAAAAEKVYIKFLLKVKRYWKNFFSGYLSWDDGYWICTNHLLLGICVFTFTHERCWTDHF